MTMVAAVIMSAAAQRGEKTLGIAGGYSSYANSGYIKGYFHYSFASHVRIAPEVGYIFPSSGDISGFEATADMHFPFRVGRGVSLYPLAGVCFYSWNRPRHHYNSLGLDVGGGMDLYFTPYLKASVEAKFVWANPTYGAMVSVGLGYVF